MRVFQTLIAFSGNAPPQLALTRELVDRGHEVRVLAHRAARERIETTGAEFVEFKQALPDLDITRRETDSVRDWEARTQLGAAKRMRDGLIAPLADATREFVGVLEDWSADVIVFDWLFNGAAIAAEHAGIPAVAPSRSRLAAPSCVRASQSRTGSVSGRVMSRSGIARRYSTNSAPVLSIRSRAARWASTRTS